MSPEVSVCIPTYNAASFIGETLASVLAQTHEDLEVVVVDDGSSDDTVERVQAFAGDARLRVIAGEHVGPVDNWNRAVGACQGTLLKLVCNDDVLAPGCVERQVAALHEHPRATMATARRDIVDEHGQRLLRARGLPRMEGVVDGEDVIARCARAGTNLIGEPTSVLFRAEAFEHAGGAWSDAWPYMVDLELWFRLLRLGDMVALPATLSAFRVHRGGWTATFGATQAKQARALFRREAERPGSRVSRADLAVGAVRAQMLQYGRRVAYALPRGAPGVPEHDPVLGPPEPPKARV
jgi:glycosyltransferase involved in cell wall biosynthesis